jgi:putative ABC transport system permease protein
LRGYATLALRHLAHHRGRTSLIAVAVALAAFLPLALDRLVTRYGASLRGRAATTPLLIGAKGSRFDLALAALYFRGRVTDKLPLAYVDAVRDGGLALPIPLALGRSAGGHPLVGTAIEYFDFRGLRLAAGTLPQFLGDAVLGAEAAAALDLAPGETLLTDRGNVFDLTKGYPLRMRVVGVLEASGTADDLAVFCDVNTCFVADGLGHGHVAADLAPAEARLEPDGGDDAGDGGAVVYNASLVEYVEITDENIDSFHFHGDLETFPLEAILAVPHDAKSATLLKGRLRLDDDVQALVPSDAVEELLTFVFRLKQFFDTHSLLVALAVAAFLALVVLLSLEVRRREFETLRRIGCARVAIPAMITIELGVALAAGLLVALASARAAESWIAGLAAG